MHLMGRRSGALMSADQEEIMGAVGVVSAEHGSQIEETRTLTNLQERKFSDIRWDFDES